MKSLIELRDEFAAAALPSAYSAIVRQCELVGWPEDWPQRVADDCYRIADCMLKAREVDPCP